MIPPAEIALARNCIDDPVRQAQHLARAHGALVMIRERLVSMEDYMAVRDGTAAVGAASRDLVIPALLLYALILL